jgi:hypothetical protein
MAVFWRLFGFLIVLNRNHHIILTGLVRTNLFLYIRGLENPISINDFHHYAYMTLGN